jgi:hypothetical protein
VEHLGSLQIDMRKIEITPQYNRPPLTTLDHQQHDFELYAIVRGSNNQRFRAETNRVLKEKHERHTRIYLLSNTDGPNKEEEEVEYAVVWEEQRIKRKINPLAIIKDSLSTMMAVSDRKQTKNPKTQTIRKLMDQQD